MGYFYKAISIIAIIGFGVITCVETEGDGIIEK